MRKIYRRKWDYTRNFGEKEASSCRVGALIFDEVRVISRLMWNSRSQQMIGIAMQAEDMALLLDVYSAYNEAEQKKKGSNKLYHAIPSCFPQRRVEQSTFIVTRSLLVGRLLRQVSTFVSTL